MNQPQTLGTRGNAMNSQLRHIVIIVKENHTFDNYFGTFPGAHGAALSAGQCGRGGTVKSD
jgi:phospholipase C